MTLCGAGRRRRIGCGAAKRCRSVTAACRPAKRGRSDPIHPTFPWCPHEVTSAGRGCGIRHFAVRLGHAGVRPRGVGRDGGLGRTAARTRQAGFGPFDIRESAKCLSVRRGTASGQGHVSIPTASGEAGTGSVVGARTAAAERHRDPDDVQPVSAPPRDLLPGVCLASAVSRPPGPGPRKSPPLTPPFCLGSQTRSPVWSLDNQFLGGLRAMGWELVNLFHDSGLGGFRLPPVAADRT